ncbi:MAG: hypothetical protein WC890_00840 [Candidatus Margulisiibacteriota bacterium]
MTKAAFFKFVVGGLVGLLFLAIYGGSAHATYYSLASISGNNVVANKVDTSTSPDKNSLYLYNISSASLETITAETKGIVSVDIDGGYVVYEDALVSSGNIHLYKISSHVDTVIATDGKWPTDVRISGNKVIYYNTANQLCAYDIPTKALSVLTAAPTYVDHVAISGDITLYEDTSLGLGSVMLYLNPRTFSGGSYTCIMPAGTCNHTVYHEAASPYVSWVESYFGSATATTIKIYDARTGLIETISSTRQIGGADIDRNLGGSYNVVYEEYDTTSRAFYIMLKDSSSRAISSSSYIQKEPKISGKYIIWSQANATYTSGAAEIRLYNILTGAESIILN